MIYPYLWIFLHLFFLWSMLPPAFVFLFPKGCAWAIISVFQTIIKAVLLSAWKCLLQLCLHLIVSLGIEFWVISYYVLSTLQTTFILCCCYWDVWCQDFLANLLLQLRLFLLLCVLQLYCDVDLFLFILLSFYIWSKIARYFVNMGVSGLVVQSLAGVGSQNHSWKSLCVPSTAWPRAHRQVWKDRDEVRKILASALKGARPSVNALGAGHQGGNNWHK